MYFKIKIKCLNCSSEMELTSEKFVDRDRLECPNCLEAFPQKEFSDMKDGIIQLDRVPEKLPESIDFFDEPKFEVSIKEWRPDTRFN